MAQVNGVMLMAAWEAPLPLPVSLAGHDARQLCVF